MSQLDDIKVKQRNHGFGPVRWTERLIMNVKDRGTAFFGRMIGIYDYVNDFDTDIEALEDLHTRANKFRELNIWLDNAPRKCRNALSRIGGDFPGTGRDAVLDPNLDLDEVSRWRDYEAGCLEASDMLDRLLKGIWDGDLIQMGRDLRIPPKKIHLIKNWWEVPSGEARSIIRHASAAGTDINDVMDAWRGQETRVIDLPGSKRTEENF